MEERLKPIDTRSFTISRFSEFSSDGRILGQCYAYEYTALKEDAEHQGTSIHRLLIDRVIASLWEAYPKFNVFVFYEALNQAIRLFVCSHRKLNNSFFKKAHSRLSRIGGYIESGYDLTMLQHIRPLVLWEPPCTMIALWPKGPEGETEGLRILDTGTMLGYHSYEDEKGYDKIKRDDLEDAELLCMPNEPEAKIVTGNSTYRYSNMFFEIQAELSEI